MFCMETAVKLLAFSWVVYEGADKRVSEAGADGDSEGCINADHHTVLQVEENVSQEQVKFSTIHCTVNCCHWILGLWTHVAKPCCARNIC